MPGAPPSALLMLMAIVAAGLSAWCVLRPPPRLRPARPTVPTGRAPGPGTGSDRALVAGLGGPAPEARFDKTTLRAVSAVGGGAAGLLLVPGVAGPVVAVVAAAVVWWRSSSWDTAGDKKRRERIAADLPHVVDLMVAALESGASPGAALERVVHAVGGPVAEELRVWLAHLDLGSDPALVWAEVARHPQLGRLGRALHRATESGAPVSAALARLAEELRARNRSEVEARVRAVEVKATLPLAACMLPAFLLLGVVPLVAGSVTGGLLLP